MFDLLEQGGPFMIPLGVSSLAALALIVDRIWQLYIRYSIDGNTLVDTVKGLIDGRNYRAALAEVDGDHPMAHVIRAGLERADRSEREIQRAMEEELVRRTPRITKRTNYLAMIANVATLLGLLGTIQGLITCFAGVADASAAEKQVVLAKGISVAMFTTFSGLIVAIPCLVAYTVLHNRELALVDQIEEAAISVFNRISSRNRDMIRAAENGSPRPNGARHASQGW